MSTDEQGDGMQQQGYGELVVPATAAGLKEAVPLLEEAVKRFDQLTSLVANGYRVLQNDLSDVPRREFAALFGLGYQLQPLEDGLREIARVMHAALQAQQEQRDQGSGWCS